MHWVFRPWRQSFNFSGRATRREYWLFQVQLVAAYIALMFLTGMLIELFHSIVINGAMAVVLVLFMAFILVASMSAGVRRVHDHDKTGWLFLLSFIPLAGWIFFLIMTLTPGTAGENSYGYDPREGDQPSADEVAAVFS
ncbi:MAG TPA: DUF805 domain-containing protein [Allosphingosinicella sp.]